MMKGAFESVVQAVGNTPIVRIQSIGAEHRPSLYAKLEYLNPGGSVKDRVAFQIITDYEESGELKPGGTVVEATSGNTGMGLALASALKGYKTVFVMPDKMSDEKIRALRAFGSRVVVCPTNVSPEDPNSYYEVAKRIVRETSGAVLANQYWNPSNPKAHYLSTGPEIWEQTGGEIDALVVAAGTGGTISGIGRYLKEKKPEVSIVGVDPVGSVYYDYFRTGKLPEGRSYKVEGFGEDHLPGTMDFSVVDDVVRVTDRECFLFTRRLVREEGICAGGSGGGAVCGAVKWAARQDADLNVVIIIPDGSGKYMSKIFNDDWMRENGYLGPEVGLGTVAEILARKERSEVITASPDDRVIEVIERMKSHGFSQLPVMQGGELVGLIGELDLLNYLVRGEADAAAPIAELVDRDFAVVEPGNPAVLVSELFTQGKVVVVLDGKKVEGILTKIDLIDHIKESLQA